MADAAHRTLFAERILRAVNDIATLPEHLRRQRYGQDWQPMLTYLEYAYDWIVY
ncbi:MULTISPECIES: hypothetical protein [Eikenella]|uniref:hypothetical protein n=1 Tax=Eikenella TaxID=538 RepID=UPI0012E73679|nr:MULTISPECIES: hypothetical protein [Eikenella]